MVYLPFNWNMFLVIVVVFAAVAPAFCLFWFVFWLIIVCECVYTDFNDSFKHNVSYLFKTDAICISSENFAFLINVPFEHINALLQFRVLCHLIFHRTPAYRFISIRKRKSAILQEDALAFWRFSRMNIYLLKRKKHVKKKTTVLCTKIMVKWDHIHIAWNSLPANVCHGRHLAHFEY